MTRIILLDIDGVLVHPGGYRAALRATVQHLLGPHVEVQEDALTDLEKRGIASEWDMTPLIIASYWTDILSRQPMQNLPDDISAAAHEIQHRLKAIAPIDVSIPEFNLVHGQYPAETAFQAGCFASIPPGLRRNLLTATRDVHASHTMRIFQHFTLGSKNFTGTYGLPAEIETESFLSTHDRSNIDDEIRSKLRQPNQHVAAFTARPSGPPCGVAGPLLGYAPEAELALELAGLQDIPLIAFGKLEYLASQYKLDPATLVKPSPLQALAATLAAWTGEEWSSLQAAYHWREMDNLNGGFSQLPKEFELIVVEDTMGGIRSVRAAGEILQRAGFAVTVRTIGLTSGSLAKASAFEHGHVQYFENWNDLIFEL
ncbi:MAG: hypothetical protein QY332_07975 [Anaerolineales bacterium]|nr:MAG: hypothetical protein QY332_07975 [Anaerolineales bacterium]